jgi:hypothetical protein
MLGLDLKTWLGLAVVGSLVSTLGALVGIFLKDFFFSWSFERWKQRQTLDLLYQKYRDPLRLSARELTSRTLEIINQYHLVPGSWLAFGEGPGKSSGQRHRTDNQAKSDIYG